MLDLSQILTFYPEHLHSFRTNLLREYLQYKILEAIFDSPLGARLSFMGGTCIHIIHSNPRFSEDLVFDNRGLTREEFEHLSRKIVTALEREGYDVEMKSTFRNAFRTFFRFRNILFESGISEHRAEKLLIEVDAEPQYFSYEADRTILNKFDVFLRVNNVPIDILLSQKLFCIFSRRRALGRDFLDTVFLLGKTRPNMEYLSLKMDIQSDEELKQKVLSRCGELNFDVLARDVEPFVYNKKDVRKIRMFSEYIEQAL